MAQLQFPLEDTDYYEGKIIFQVRIERPPEIRNRRSEETVVDLDAGSELSGDTKRDLERSSSNTFFNNTQVIGKTRVSLGERAVLYMPQGLQFQDGVEYEGADLGRIGGGARAAVQQGSTIGEAVRENNVITSISDIFRGINTPDAARLATARAAQFGGENFGRGVQSALRVTTNPNVRQLFRRVNTRDFAFTFRLIPTSRDEAEASNALIKFFRTELYPEDTVRIDVGGGASLPIGYKFPNTFDIKFKHRNSNIIHRILPSYLTSFSANYNPTGAGFFEDGNFSEIEITMNFRESRTLTKQLVRDGGY